MKTRIISMLLVLTFIALYKPAAVCAASDPLSDKHTYYTEEEDYISGDCILTATRMMIRRAAIMRGRAGWADITNKTLRPEATVDGCLLSSFSFEDEGLTYNVSFGEFKGESDSARIAEFASLLEDHPEGVVVHGDWAASTGTHGVLVVGIENGQVYTVDASYNMGVFNDGIQKWEDTTMLEPSLSTRYWYISSIEQSVMTDEERALKRLCFNLLRCS